MKEVRRSIGEIQQSLLAFFPLFPLATGMDQSNLSPLGLSWCGRIIPSPNMKGYLWLLFFVCHLLCFPCLEVFSLSFKECCSVFGNKVRRTQQSQACVPLKGRKKTLALAYFIGSLPDPNHLLSPPLLLLWSAHSNIPLATLFPPLSCKTSTFR